MRLTIKHIAQMAGVSNATVSRVINNRDAGVGEDTRQRIKQIIREQGYRINVIAKSMVTRRTNSIGLIIPDVSNPFFSDIAKSVEATAEASGFTVFLCNSDDTLERERRYISALGDRGVDGIVLVPASIGTREPDDLGFIVPVVLMDRPLSGRNVGVYIDNAHGEYLATELLIKEGHRKLAFCGGLRSDHNVANRFKGFRQACSDYGIEVNEDTCLFGEFTVQAGISHSEQIAVMDVSACVCANDLIALGLIAGLKKFGKLVPNDISVTGFDNILLSEINSPSITTVRQPTIEMGAIATRMLFDLIEKPELKILSKVFQTELVIRDSTRPFPASQPSL
ncbi:MAG: LacI family DNA-binding transcriptional regulator [Spirochaetota bacterium]